VTAREDVLSRCTRRISLSERETWQRSPHFEG